MKFAILALLFATSASAGIIQPAPSPSPLPVARAQAVAAAQIKGGANALFQQMVRTVSSMAAVVWANPNGLTAQQVFTGLGVNQCDAHEKFLALATVINAAVPGTIPAEPATVTESGSGGSCVVTVSQ